MEALHHQSHPAFPNLEAEARIRTQNARASRKAETLCPNPAVRWAFYLSIIALPFLGFYIPGTGERVGSERIIQVLILLAIFSRPKVCLRLVPVPLLWFLAYCA